MQLLFATSIVPDGGLGSGYEIANAAVIGALRRAGARVTVLGFSWPGKPPADPDNTIVLGETDVRTDAASAMQKLRWLGEAVRTGLTFSSVKLRIVSDEAVRAAIRRAGPFDGYVLNSVQFAGAFGHLLQDRPSIFVAHNVEHRSAAENAAAAGSVVERFLFRREARLLQEMEAWLCREARFVFTLAEEDRAALAVASPGRSAALPLVTRETPPPPPDPRERRYDAALIGTWTWQPNRIGLDWFLEAVVPHLAPDFSVRIAGRVPLGVTCSHPGVEFVGRVPDAEAFVRGAAVVPLISRAGTGVQLKTIEAFELGLPSVATSHSLRGIQHLPENCVVADDPAEFAQALQRAARQGLPDVDGRAFHRRQLAALDREVRRGLEALAATRREMVA